MDSRSPQSSRLYANKDGDDLDYNKIKGVAKQPSTMSPHHALQFATREECQAWCDTNPHPVFVPVGHGFMDPPSPQPEKTEE